MPGKAGNPGTNCTEPERHSEETWKGRGPAPGLATPVLIPTGIPVSAEKKAQGREASHIRSRGGGAGPST